MDRNAPTPDRIVELGFGFRGARVLMSAVELGVFTSLAEVRCDSDTLRRRLELHERGARDFFDALVALRLLQRDDSGSYSNSPDADLYLDRRKPTYIGGLVENLNAREYGMWGSLTEALRTGKTQTGFESKAYYASLYSDPKRLDFFVKGMTAWTLPVAKAIAAKFPWCDYKTMADIGTGQGCLPVEIAAVHADIAATGFDLAALRPMFENYVNEYGLAERVRFLPGDFFADPMPGADVLVMGRILHNWDLPTKRMLMQKAYDALPSGGALIVYEWLIDDSRREATAGLLSSLNMLIMTAGGFDFTGTECIDWMREVGFRDLRVEPLAAAQSMVIGLK